LLAPSPPLSFYVIEASRSKRLVSSSQGMRMQGRPLTAIAFATATLSSVSARAIEPDDYHAERCKAYPSECGLAPLMDAPPSAPMQATYGLQLGVSFSVAVSASSFTGEAVASNPSPPGINDIYGAWLPIGLEGGYRFNRHLYVGGQYLLGRGTRGTDCAPPNVACSGDVMELLGDARVYLAPDSRVGAWLGIGGGWEVASFSIGAGHATYSGPVIAHLELGLDVRGGALAVGPYLGVSFSRFSSHSLEPEPAGFTSTLDDRSTHAWVAVGIRGSYGPW
jgi:hypothetical protein